MKQIGRLVCIICILILALGLNLFGENLSSAKYTTYTTIYSAQQQKIDIFNSHEMEAASISSVNQNIKNARRIKTFSYTNSFIGANIAQNKLNEIISHIYLKAFLNSKEKNLLRISYSISPNAP